MKAISEYVVLELIPKKQTNSVFLTAHNHEFIVQSYGDDVKGLTIGDSVIYEKNAADTMHDTNDKKYTVVHKTQIKAVI